MSHLPSIASLPPLGLQPLVFGHQYDMSDPDQLETFVALVAGLGYTALEANPSDPETFIKILERHGVAHAGFHVGLNGGVDTTSIIRALSVTGARDVCNSGLLKWGGLTAEDYHQAIPVLNDLGVAFAREGIRFHYHHHEFEFDVVEGSKTGMDLLFEGLDLSVIDFCVDVAWVYRGGVDPATFLREHEAHIGYVHLKDTTDKTMTELGAGSLDFDAILTTVASISHVHWAMVEQDETRIDPAESCRISREFLKGRYGY